MQRHTPLLHVVVHGPAAASWIWWRMSRIRQRGTQTRRCSDPERFSAVDLGRAHPLAMDLGWARSPVAYPTTTMVGDDVWMGSAGL
jgi:hypothetical protein